MTSKRLPLALLVTAFAGCAPTVTIADGSSGSGGEEETGDRGNAGSGGTSGGSTSNGGVGTAASPSGSASGAGVCYIAAGSGNVVIPCGGSPNGGSAGAGVCYVAAGSGNIVVPCGGSPNGGSSGDAGTGTGLPARCRQSIEPYIANFSACDVRSEMQYCAKGGCHNATTAAARLDLTLDDYLIARILDVPATLEHVPGVPTCLPEGCPTGALLLDRSSPEDSWMMRKMEPFIPGTTDRTSDMGCGNAMPTFDTTGTWRYSDASKMCLIEFFRTLAREGAPCPTAAGGEPPLPPPPCSNGD